MISEDTNTELMSWQISEFFEQRTGREKFIGLYVRLNSRITPHSHPASFLILRDCMTGEQKRIGQPVKDSNAVLDLVTSALAMIALERLRCQEGAK